MKRIVSVPGFAAEEISMSQEDAVLVDQLIADEPKGDDEAKCDYWKLKLSEVPPSNKGAVQYAEKKGGGVCRNAGK